MADDPTFPMALEAPDTTMTLLTREMADNALAMAAQSPRGRIIQRLHKDNADTLHRMLNAMQPGTYFRPHRHLDPPKSEAVIVLRGALRVIEFSPDGDVLGWADMRPGGEVFGVDSVPGVYHTFIVLEPDTLIFESKDGPYQRATDKDFPDWAPEEGGPDCRTYLEYLLAITGG